MRAWKNNDEEEALKHYLRLADAAALGAYSVEMITKMSDEIAMSA